MVTGLVVTSRKFLRYERKLFVFTELEIRVTTKTLRGVGDIL